MLHLHLEIFKQNPGEKESFNTIKNEEGRRRRRRRRRKKKKGTFIKDKASSLPSSVNTMIHEILSVSPGNLPEHVSVKR